MVSYDGDVIYLANYNVYTAVSLVLIEVSLPILLLLCICYRVPTVNLIYSHILIINPGSQCQILQKVVIVSITKNVCKLGVDTSPIAVNKIQPIVKNSTHF